MKPSSLLVAAGLISAALSNSVADEIAQEIENALHRPKVQSVKSTVVPDRDAEEGMIEELLKALESSAAQPKEDVKPSEKAATVVKQPEVVAPAPRERVVVSLPGVALPVVTPTKPASKLPQYSNDDDDEEDAEDEEDKNDDHVPTQEDEEQVSNPDHAHHDQEDDGAEMTEDHQGPADEEEEDGEDEGHEDEAPLDESPMEQILDGLFGPLHGVPSPAPMFVHPAMMHPAGFLGPAHPLIMRIHFGAPHFSTGLAPALPHGLLSMLSMPAAIHPMVLHFGVIPPHHFGMMPPMYPGMMMPMHMPAMPPMDMDSFPGFPSASSSSSASSSHGSNVEEVTFGPNGGQVHDFGVRPDGSKYDVTVPVPKGGDLAAAEAKAESEVKAGEAQKAVQEDESAAVSDDEADQEDDKSNAEEELSLPAPAPAKLAQQEEHEKPAVSQPVKAVSRKAASSPAQAVAPKEQVVKAKVVQVAQAPAPVKETPAKTVTRAEMAKAIEDILDKVIHPAEAH